MSQNNTQGKQSKTLRARPTSFDFSRDESVIIVDFAGFVHGPKGGFYALARNLLAASVPVALFQLETSGTKGQPSHKTFIDLVRDIPTINQILNGQVKGLEAIPASRLARLRAYLGALKGYDPAKGNNQNESTLDQHRLVVDKAEESLRRGLTSWGKPRKKEQGRAENNGRKVEALPKQSLAQPERTIERVKAKNITITKAVEVKDGKAETVYRAYKEGEEKPALVSPFLKAIKEWVDAQ